LTLLPLQGLDFLTLTPQLLVLSLRSIVLSLDLIANDSSGQGTEGAADRGTTGGMTRRVTDQSTCAGTESATAERSRFALRKASRGAAGEQRKAQKPSCYRSFLQHSDTSPPITTQRRE
jgi:hypothetical protein